MYCKYCGKQIQDQSRFCCFCGKALTRRAQRTAIQETDMPEREWEITGNEVTPDYSGASVQAERHGSQYGKFERNSPRPEQKKLHGIVKQVFSLLWGLLLLCAVLYSLNPDNNILHIGDMRKAYKYAKEVLEEEVLVTDHEFPKFESRFVNQRSKNVVYEGDDYRVYTVSAYVYEENVFGTRMKTRYVVEIGFPTDKDVDGIYYNVVSYGDS